MDLALTEPIAPMYVTVAIVLAFAAGFLLTNGFLGLRQTIKEKLSAKTA